MAVTFHFLNTFLVAFILTALLDDNSTDASYIKFATNTKQPKWEEDYSEYDYLQHSNGEYSYSSGKYDDYVDAYEHNNKDDDFEGSAESSGDFKDNTRDSESQIDLMSHHNSRCLQMLQQANKENIPGSFVPRCTFDGYFSSLQCHGGTGECWCSTKDGRQIPGSLSSDPLMTSCNNYEDKVFDNQKVKGSYEGRKKEEVGKKKQDWVDEQIILKGIETKNNHEKNEILVPYDNFGNNNNNNKKKKIMKEEMRKYNESNSNQRNESLFISSLRLHSLLSQPGLLAAIICLLLVSLLCIVSVVVLSVCRLRQRHDKKNLKGPLESDSIINGYTSHLTYTTPNNYNNTGEIYAGGGFSYTPGISPAKCQTMNLRMSPWAHGNSYHTNKSTHLVYSKCAEQDMFA